MSELAFVLRGLGFWAPGYPTPEAWIARAADCPEDQAATPKAELLPPMLRRRTSLLTRMAAEVAHQAIRRGGLDPANTAMVYGSVYGEIRTTLDLLAALLEPGAPLSPTKFHNSVHNTAAGYVSISTGNRVGDAALSAGRATLAMGLLEAAARVACEGGDAVLVIAEEPLPEPLAAGRRYGPLAAAFAVSAPGRTNMPGRPCLLVQGPADMPSAPPPSWLAENPCAAALALIDAAMRPEPAAVALEPASPGWTCRLAGPA
jgi:hypothetical protein